MKYTPKELYEITKLFNLDRLEAFKAEVLVQAKYLLKNAKSTDDIMYCDYVIVRLSKPIIYLGELQC